MLERARWVLPKIEEARAESLAAAISLHLPVARALLHRGYTDPEAARRYLQPSLGQLHDPFLLRDMDRAVQRLLEAIRREQTILLYGDYDVDGVLSVVTLKIALEMAGGRVLFHIPHRVRDGYGMHAGVVEQAAGDGVRLVVSVDTGIRAAEVVGRARELGIDVIVTDHHLPGAELPPACAVLNPKRPDCGYPDKNLCGAGVTFKLIEALLRALDWPAGRRERVLQSLLKLVAIATVADVVPLVGENRVFVKHGLEGLRSVRNPGLRALLDSAGIPEGAAPSASQVAFRIAPRLNAAGRMADAADVIELFMTGDAVRARELATRLDELNQTRQQAETEILRDILEECSRIPVTAAQKAIVFAGTGWHRGVVGIVAARLVERYHRPALVLSLDPETGLAQGSGRSIPAFHLLEALESQASLLVRFGGHRQAVGLTLAAERIPEFQAGLNDYAAAHLVDKDLIPELGIDAAVRFRELDDASVAEILSMAPFGFGNPAPVFAVFDVEAAGAPSVLKEKHLRVRFRQDERTLGAVGWNFSGRAAELEAGAHIDVALCFEEDTYSARRGYPGWRAVLRDVRPVP
jgi:single-stranded-DNA-specific exonuclease